MAASVNADPTQVFELQGYDAKGNPILVPDKTATITEGSPPGSPTGTTQGGAFYVVKRKSFLWPSRQLRGRAVLTPGSALLAGDGRKKSSVILDKGGPAGREKQSATQRMPTDSKGGEDEGRRSGKFYSRAPSVGGEKSYGQPHAREYQGGPGMMDNVLGCLGMGKDGKTIHHGTLNRTGPPPSVGRRGDGRSIRTFDAQTGGRDVGSIHASSVGYAQGSAASTAAFSDIVVTDASVDKSSLSMTAAPSGSPASPGSLSMSSPAPVSAPPSAPPPASPTPASPTLAPPAPPSTRGQPSAKGRGGVRGRGSAKGRGGQSKAPLPATGISAKGRGKVSGAKGGGKSAGRGRGKGRGRGQPGKHYRSMEQSPTLPPHHHSQHREEGVGRRRELPEPGRHFTSMGQSPARQQPRHHSHHRGEETMSRLGVPDDNLRQRQPSYHHSYPQREKAMQRTEERGPNRGMEQALSFQHGHRAKPGLVGRESERAMEQRPPLRMHHTYRHDDRTMPNPGENDAGRVVVHHGRRNAQKPNERLPNQHQRQHVPARPQCFHLSPNSPGSLCSSCSPQRCLDFMRRQQ